MISADESVAPFDRLVDMGSTLTANLTRWFCHPSCRRAI